ncbi:glutamine--fructose-6-phosphate aminotransferase [isomerizing] 2, partial [Tachysurus ichikawai]
KDVNTDVRRRRGSPLLIGIRSQYKLSTEQIPIQYYGESRNDHNKNFINKVDKSNALHSVNDRMAVEFYFASDAR